MRTTAIWTQVVGERALKLGRAAAAKCGLPDVEVEDCAAEFAALVLAYLTSEPAGERLLTLSEQSLYAWMHRCAYDYAGDYRRGASSNLGEPLPLPSDAGRKSSLLLELPALQPVQEPLRVPTEQDERVHTALEQLPALARGLFIAHHIEHVGVLDLALEYGRSPEAVTQLLWRAQRRLQRILQQQEGSLADLSHELMTGLQSVSSASLGWSRSSKGYDIE